MTDDSTTTEPVPRPPDVIEGETLGVRPGPRSPLAPGPDGVWPTVLRPAPLDPPSSRPPWWVRFGRRLGLRR